MADISAIKLPNGVTYNVKDNEAVTEIGGTSPISVTDNEDGTYDIEHEASGVRAGTYTGGISKATLYLPSITVDEQGHVTVASNSGRSVGTVSQSNSYGLMSRDLYECCIRVPTNFFHFSTSYYYCVKFLAAGDTTDSWTIADPASFDPAYGINVYDVVARDTTTGEQVLVDWYTTINSNIKSCELTVSIAEPYENEIAIVPFVSSYVYGH